MSLKTSQECVGEPAIGPSKDCAEVVIRAVGSLCAGVVLPSGSVLERWDWHRGSKQTVLSQLQRQSINTRACKSQTMPFPCNSSMESSVLWDCPVDEEAGKASGLLVFFHIGQQLCSEGSG